MSSIKLENINKSFGEHIVLDDFSCEIPQGKITALVGPSGCGKTTLMRILAGLDTNYTGKVIGSHSDISFVFQENRLIPWLTGYENMLFSVEHLPYFNETDEDISKLISIAQLTDHIHKLPKELSGGMQRRVSLLRAFINRSSLMLLDEPFTGLDKKTKLTIADNLLSYADTHNRTLVIVSHDEHIIELAHNQIVMG